MASSEKFYSMRRRANRPRQMKRAWENWDATPAAAAAMVVMITWKIFLSVSYHANLSGRSLLYNASQQNHSCCLQKVSLVNRSNRQDNRPQTTIRLNPAW